MKKLRFLAAALALLMLAAAVIGCTPKEGDVSSDSASDTTVPGESTGGKESTPATGEAPATGTDVPVSPDTDPGDETMPEESGAVTDPENPSVTEPATQSPSAGTTATKPAESSAAATKPSGSSTTTKPTESSPATTKPSGSSSTATKPAETSAPATKPPSDTTKPVETTTSKEETTAPPPETPEEIFPSSGPYRGIPVNGKNRGGTFSGYNKETSTGFSFSSQLVFTFKQPQGGSFNRFSFEYSASAPVKCTVYSTAFGNPVTQEFFLEATNGARRTFSALGEEYFNKLSSSDIARFVFTPMQSGSVEVMLYSVNTETIAWKTRTAVLKLTNSYYELGIDLNMGGGIASIVSKSSSKYKNLLNRADSGRLVQQSYYGTNSAPYVPGYYGENLWPYNPVQGGDVFNNRSTIIDFSVSDTEIFIRCQPLNWAPSGKSELTPSYMENTYSLSGKHIRVDNRFTDFSGYTHTRRHQEIPAFYVISALDTFVYCPSESGWTGQPLAKYDNLGFWADSQYSSKQRFYQTYGKSESWCAWVDKNDFGIGVYVPGAEHFYAGRYSYNGSSDPNNGATNYVAPVITLQLKSGKPLTYSYIIAAGSSAEIRQIFSENRNAFSNDALVKY